MNRVLVMMICLSLTALMVAPTAAAADDRSCGPRITEAYVPPDFKLAGIGVGFESKPGYEAIGISYETDEGWENAGGVAVESGSCEVYTLAECIVDELLEQWRIAEISTPPGDEQEGGPEVDDGSGLGDIDDCFR